MAICIDLWSFGSQPAWRYVAIHLSLRPDEDDAVPGGIAGVPLHLLVGHRDARAARDHALAVGDDGDIVVALDLECIGLEGVRHAATAHGGVVRLREGLEPFAHVGRKVSPLPV